MKRAASIIDEAFRAVLLPMQVETALGSFKASVDAYEVAAFDGWLDRKPIENTTSPAEVWDAIGKLTCFDPDWRLFKTQLVRHGDSEAVCRCGAHFVTAFLIRQRWTLLVLGCQSLLKPASELLPVRTRTLEKLARIFPELDKGPTDPPVDPARGGSGGGGANPAELAIPLRWARGKN